MNVLRSELARLKNRWGVGGMAQAPPLCKQKAFIMDIQKFYKRRDICAGATHLMARCSGKLGKGGSRALDAWRPFDAIMFSLYKPQGCYQLLGFQNFESKQHQGLLNPAIV